MRSAGRRVVWASGVCALGGWVVPAVQAQTAGDLRVPDYISGEPANRPNLAPSRSADASGDFQNLPGQPYRGPVGPIARGMVHATRYQGFTYGFFATLQISYTDNALLAQGAGGSSDDLILSPSLGANVSYALSENSRLDLHVGVGYRYSLNYRSLTQLSIVPNSYLSYQILVGDVQMTFFNHSATGANNRPELAGNGTALGVDLNRVSNETGITATWAPTPDMSVSGGYTFQIDRGLNESFGILDQTSHILHAGVFDRLSPFWTVGLQGQAAFTEFVQRFQNDSKTYSVGPVVAFHPTQYISITGSVSYQISQFGSNGGVNDNRAFNGLVWSVGISQILNRQLSHALNASSGVTTGLGSNFTENFQVGYSIGWQFRPDIGVNAGITYSDIKQSGRSDVLILVKDPSGTFLIPGTVSFNDSAILYDFRIGTGYQFTPRLYSSLTYNYTRRESRFSSRSYSSQTVTLALGLNF